MSRIGPKFGNFQLDPSLAYAYSLLGHEYFSIEDLDKAGKSFRAAIQVDPLHFNGWYKYSCLRFLIRLPDMRRFCVEGTAWA